MKLGRLGDEEQYRYDVISGTSEERDTIQATKKREIVSVDYAIVRSCIVRLDTFTKAGSVMSFLVVSTSTSPGATVSTIVSSTSVSSVLASRPELLRIELKSKRLVFFA